MSVLIEKVPTTYSGKLDVFIQGDLSNRAGKIVFLTVHDFATDHESVISIVNHHCMTEVKRKSIFLHVCLLSHESNSPSFEFPTLDGIAHDLVEVLDNFRIKTVIAIGEGAGANIVCRFGFHYSNRCLGLILLDMTPTSASFDENVDFKMYKMREGGCRMMGRFAQPFSYSKFRDLKTSGDTIANLSLAAENSCLYNTEKYIESYMKRTDITHMVSGLRVESLVVVGSRGPFISSAYKINRLNPKMTTMLIVDGVHDVLMEAPRNFARALILFCKGCGVLLGVPMIGLEQAFNTVNARQISNDNKENTLTCSQDLVEYLAA